MAKKIVARKGGYISTSAYYVAALMTCSFFSLPSIVLGQTVEEPAIASPEVPVSDDPINLPKTDTSDSAKEEISTGPDLGRVNPRISTVDGISVNNNPGRNEASGVPVGAFTLRPTLSQSFGTERTNDGLSKSARTFSQTGLKGALTSDWSSHQLTINGEGTWQRTFAGQKDDSPEFKLDGLLRLDVTRDTTANITAAFTHAREAASAANAIQNASLQANVDQYSAGADVIHDFGPIRTTLGLALQRSIYGSAMLDNGTIVSQADRDSTTATLRGRIGYELSPALTPFIEATYGRTQRDMRIDNFGYRRNAQAWAAKAGTEVDLGEKLRGELSGGYSLERFEDSRLADIAALTIDGNATWSPQRGTDVTLGLTTGIEPSTTAGVSGAATYTLRGEVAQVILTDLTARINLSRTWRNYDDNTIVSDQRVLATGAGFTWGLSRYLDLTGDASYEVTRQSGAPQSDIFKATFGLALKR